MKIIEDNTNASSLFKIIQIQRIVISINIFDDDVRKI